MKFKIVKIDGEFVIVETVDGIQKVCPATIFSKEIKVGDFAEVIVCNN